MDSHNTFDQPNNVSTTDFNDYKVTEEGIQFVIPACSVLHFTVE